MSFVSIPTMKLSRTLAAAAVVVVAAFTSTAAEPRNSYYGHDSSVRWPWLGPHRGTPMHGPLHAPRHSPPFSAPFHPSPFSYGGHDTYADYGDYEPSYQASQADDLDRRILEAQRKCREDFLLLRRLLQEQHYLLKGTPLDIPQQPPTIFRLPLFPGYGSEGEHGTSDGFPFVVDSDEDYDYSSDEGDVFLDSPVPGPEWAIIPYLPEVPDADDLPDNYNNETHTIHVINGTRVEVNTTTNKETDDSITTFFHTEVIHVLPDLDTTEEEPEQPVTEEPLPATTPVEIEVPTTQVADVLPEEEIKVEKPEEDLLPEATPEEEVVPTTQQPEEPPAEDDATVNEVPFVIPIPSAELVANEEMRLQRDAGLMQDADETGRPSTVTRHSAYVKHPSKGRGKNVKPKDLSGDTLVNQLARNSTDGKTEEDAEILL